MFNQLIRLTALSLLLSMSRECISNEPNAPLQGIIDPMLTECSLTNHTAGGGLGDQLRNYLRAKWAAYIYHAPYYLTPFSKCELFMLDEIEMKLQEADSSWIAKEELSNPVRYDLNKLYVPYPWYIGKESHLKKFKIEQIDDIVKDRFFCNMLKELFVLKKPVATFHPPASMPSVACHIRRPSRCDLPLKANQFHHFSEEEKKNFETFIKNPKSSFYTQQHPDKFPCLQYYINEIKKLSSLLNNEPIYVHIFTDDKNPQKLTNLIRQKVNLANITFCYTRGKNLAKSSMIEDFYSFMNFDYLIRSNSCFSLIPMLIGDYKMVIYPKSFAWKNNTLVVKDVERYQRNFP